MAHQLPLNQLHNYRRDIYQRAYEHALRTAGGLYNTKLKRNIAKGVIGASATYGWIKGKPQFPSAKRVVKGTATTTAERSGARTRRPVRRRRCRLSTKYECCKCKSRYFRKIKY